MSRDVKAILERCGARNTRLEGIEMIIELEDLTGAQPAPPSLMREDGARLYALELQALSSLVDDLDAATDRELQQAAEVAAAIDFGVASQ